MASSPFSFWQISTLILVVLIAGWLIRRAGAGLRAELEDKKGAAGSLLTPEQVHAITANGLATAEQLFMMSAKEQQLLAITAMTLQSAKAKGTPPS
jgi:hypothetical protein